MLPPRPPGGPEEPDQEEAGQAARLRTDMRQTESELRGAGGGQHIQVDAERNHESEEREGVLVPLTVRLKRLRLLTGR